MCFVLLRAFIAVITAVVGMVVGGLASVKITNGKNGDVNHITESNRNKPAHTFELCKSGPLEKNCCQKQNNSSVITLTEIYVSGQKQK